MHPRKYRLGTTSYIIPDDILPNVRFLANQIDDIELVLFEVDNGPNNLPGQDTLQALKQLAGQHQLTYTVHLPLDIKLGEPGGQLDVSLLKAQKVIDCTLPLSPFAYVLHLDGRSVLDGTLPGGKAKWVEQAARSLEILSGWTGNPQNLAVENLENYPVDFWDDVLDQVPASRCIDVGHLWLGGVDPIPYLRRHLPRAKVIHLHGIHTRDHQSLRHVPPEQLERVVSLLNESAFSGVATLEIFNRSDFETSLQAIQAFYR
jgi:sugar phosphate isomerase/epimerase